MLKTRVLVSLPKGGTIEFFSDTCCALWKIIDDVDDDTETPSVSGHVSLKQAALLAVEMEIFLLYEL